MQDPESGVPVRSQKQFLTSIPSAFMGECHRYLRCGVSVSGRHGQNTTVACLRVAGYDLIEWLMERLAIEESGTGSYDRCRQLAQPQPFRPSGGYANDTLSILPLRSIRSVFASIPSAALKEYRLYTNTLHSTRNILFRSSQI